MTHQQPAPRPTGTEPPAPSRSGVLIGGVEYVLPRRWGK